MTVSWDLYFLSSTTYSVQQIWEQRMTQGWGGPWRTPCLLKMPFNGPRPRRSGMEEKIVSPIWGVGGLPNLLPNIWFLTSSLNFCLFFAVPPQRIKIIDDSGRDCTGSGVVGPYRIGDTAALKCIAYGGERDAYIKIARASYNALLS